MMMTAQGWLHIHVVQSCAQQQGTLHALHTNPYTSTKSSDVELLVGLTLSQWASTSAALPTEEDLPQPHSGPGQVQQAHWSWCR